MALLLLQTGRRVAPIYWSAVSSGNNAGGNQFLHPTASRVAPTTTEAVGQTVARYAFEIWRMTAQFTNNGAQTATLTPRINGVSQVSLATSILNAGIVQTDLTSPIRVAFNDKLGILFVTTNADATTTHPRGVLDGRVADSC